MGVTVLLRLVEVAELSLSVDAFLTHWTIASCIFINPLVSAEVIPLIVDAPLLFFGYLRRAGIIAFFRLVDSLL